LTIYIVISPLKPLLLKLLNLIFKKSKTPIFQALSINKEPYKVIISAIIFLKNTNVNVSIAEKAFLNLKWNT